MKKESLNLKFEYKAGVANCPLCGIGISESLKDWLPAFFISNLYLCKSCGLLYYKQANNKIQKVISVHDEFKDAKVDYEKEYLEGKKIYHLLDNEGLLGLGSPLVVIIGNGIQGISNYFKEMDCEVLEITLINQEKETTAIKLIHEYFSNANFSRRIDLLISYHHIEKITDYDSDFRFLMEYTHEETVLYVATNGVKNRLCIDQNSLYSLTNTCIFSLRSLVNMLHPFGFKLIKGNESIFALFKIDKDKDIFVSDYKEIRKYLKRSVLILNIIALYRHIKVKIEFKQNITKLL